MRIVSWNVNGLRALLNKEELFFNWFVKDKPDILCLQETKLQAEQIPSTLSRINTYLPYWNFAQKKGYSGTLVLTRPEPVSVSTTMGVDEFDAEGRTIIADYPDFTLINCYFPNGQMSPERLDYKMRFYDRMFEIMQDYTARGIPLMVCGDYNTAHKEIDLTHPKANEGTSGFLPLERAWLDKLIAHGYTDTFRHFDPRPRQYSWWSFRARARQNNVGWRIDYFFANPAALARVQSAFILPEVMGSDHCPVGVEINSEN